MRVFLLIHIFTLDKWQTPLFFNPKCFHLILLKSPLYANTILILEKI